MKLTKRGEIVFLIALALLIASAVLGIYKVATSIWWTDEGYCYGSVTKCYEEEGK